MHMSFSWGNFSIDNTNYGKRGEKPPKMQTLDSFNIKPQTALDSFETLMKIRVKLVRISGFYGTLKQFGTSESLLQILSIMFKMRQKSKYCITLGNCMTWLTC
ncbi:otospiralin [Platysternon megacephalum]|uniref:Otospiralin n=1 Tax=Platysternon megacephalum TaxID=55544 RepID=A0A4D9E7V7_9SAUR|nr:otospiralin [Platysternon megacephalum]